MNNTNMQCTRANVLNTHVQNDIQKLRNFKRNTLDIFIKDHLQPFIDGYAEANNLPTQQLAPPQDTINQILSAPKKIAICRTLQLLVKKIDQLEHSINYTQEARTKDNAAIRAEAGKVGDNFYHLIDNNLTEDFQISENNDPHHIFTPLKSYICHRNNGSLRQIYRNLTGDRLTSSANTIVDFLEAQMNKYGRDAISSADKITPEIIDATSDTAKLRVYENILKAKKNSMLFFPNRLATHLKLVQAKLSQQEKGVREIITPEASPSQQNRKLPPSGGSASRDNSPQEHGKHRIISEHQTIASEVRTPIKPRTDNLVRFQPENNADSNYSIFTAAGLSHNVNRTSTGLVVSTETKENLITILNKLLPSPPPPARFSQLFFSPSEAPSTQAADFILNNIVDITRDFIFSDTQTIQSQIDDITSQPKVMKALFDKFNADDSINIIQSCLSNGKLKNIIVEILENNPSFLEQVLPRPQKTTEDRSARRINTRIKNGDQTITGTNEDIGYLLEKDLNRLTHTHIVIKKNLNDQSPLNYLVNENNNSNDLLGSLQANDNSNNVLFSKLLLTQHYLNLLANLSQLTDSRANMYNALTKLNLMKAGSSLTFERNMILSPGERSCTIQFLPMFNKVALTSHAVYVRAYFKLTNSKVLNEATIQNLKFNQVMNFNVLEFYDQWGSSNQNVINLANEFSQYRQTAIDIRRSNHPSHITQDNIPSAAINEDLPNTTTSSDNTQHLLDHSQTKPSGNSNSLQVDLRKDDITPRSENLPNVSIENNLPATIKNVEGKISEKKIDDAYKVTNEAPQKKLNIDEQIQLFTASYDKLISENSTDPQHLIDAGLVASEILDLISEESTNPQRLIDADLADNEIFDLHIGNKTPPTNSSFSVTSLALKAIELFEKAEELGSSEQKEIASTNICNIYLKQVSAEPDLEFKMTRLQWASNYLTPKVDQPLLCKAILNVLHPRQKFDYFNEKANQQETEDKYWITAKLIVKTETLMGNHNISTDIKKELDKAGSSLLEKNLDAYRMEDNKQGKTKTDFQTISFKISSKPNKIERINLTETKESNKKSALSEILEEKLLLNRYQELAAQKTTDANQLILTGHAALDLLTWYIEHKDNTPQSAINDPISIWANNAIKNFKKAIQAGSEEEKLDANASICNVYLIRYHSRLQLNSKIQYLIWISQHFNSMVNHNLLLKTLTDICTAVAPTSLTPNQDRAFYSAIKTLQTKANELDHNIKDSILNCIKNNLPSERVK